MTWTIEIIRAFFVAFGAMQSISNLTYLLKKDGIMFARKQHRELPDNVTFKQLRLKIICMLSFGIFFLIIALVSYITRTYYKSSFILVMGTYSFYALIEAVYYKFWRTTGAFLLSLFIVVYLLFS